MSASESFMGLIGDLKKIGMPPMDFAVFGSGPMAVRGLRDTEDIDVIARGRAWEIAKSKGERRTSEFGDESYAFADGKIEVVDRWADWNVDELIDGADEFEGIRFVNLETTQKEKIRRGRDKDLKDVELIGRYMAGIGGQFGMGPVAGLSRSSDYRQHIASLSDEELTKHMEIKKQEFATMLETSTTVIGKSPILIALLGCPDRRIIPMQHKMFEEVLGKTVKMTVYDISIDHLQGEPGVIQHDATEPLPGGPYDFVFAHMLLRFIEADQQWYVIFNSYEALKPGGLAIHALDESDYATEGETTPNGFHTVPLERWKDKMRALGMEYFEVPIDHGVALAIVKK